MRRLFGEDVAHTGPGAHDEQLTPQMFFAIRRTEVGGRLEYMAVARGRPRPGQLHPDAEVDDQCGRVQRNSS